MNDAIGLCAELISVVLTVAGNVAIHRGVNSHDLRLEYLGKLQTVFAAVFTSIALFVLPESIVGPLGVVTIPTTYFVKRSSTTRREWIYVFVIMVGSITMTISKPPSRKPNPLNVRVLWCILFGCFVSVILLQFQSRPVFAGIVGSFTQTFAKAALTAVVFPVYTVEMTVTYGFAALVFGYVQLDFISRAYFKFSEKQMMPLYLVSMVFFEVVLANWVFQEMDNWSWGFVGGFLVALGSALVV